MNWAGSPKQDQSHRAGEESEREAPSTASECSRHPMACSRGEPGTRTRLMWYKTFKVARKQAQKNYFLAIFEGQNTTNKSNLKPLGVKITDSSISKTKMSKLLDVILVGPQEKESSLKKSSAAG